MIGIMCRRHVALAALKVSLVVGTILNLVNQGDRLLNGEALKWGQIALNYFVPYCVSSYSAARAVLRSTGRSE